MPLASYLKIVLIAFSTFNQTNEFFFGVKMSALRISIQAKCFLKKALFLLGHSVHATPSSSLAFLKNYLGIRLVISANWY